MSNVNIGFGILNISCGLLFILISIPLVKKKIPMNRLYGFRFAKSFVSDENWYAINSYGGEQLIRWSVLPVFTGFLYFIFPISDARDEGLTTLLAVAPILICTTVAIIKTHLFSRKL
ncbi:MAG: SdpI family protein [Desulfobacteraceae bacterium]|nr:MAG: SdpI family protein [Desulfobacteraceae bacterium]